MHPTRIAATVLACLLLLSGCAKKQHNTFPKSDGFTAAYTLEGADLSLSGSITRDADGTLRLKVSEPSVFADAEFCLQNGKTTVSYCGITMDLPENEITAKGIAATLGSLFDAADKDGALSGTTAAGRYRITVNDENSCTIELPDAGLTCTLSRLL